MTQLLTIEQAARRLAISEATLRDWRVDGKFLAFVSIGGAVRIEESEIERFVAECRQTPDSRAGRVKRRARTVGKNVVDAASGGSWNTTRQTPRPIDFPA